MFQLYHTDCDYLIPLSNKNDQMYDCNELTAAFEARFGTNRKFTRYTDNSTLRLIAAVSVNRLHAKNLATVASELIRTARSYS